MKANVLQRSRILRYEGEFSDLSAFFLCPSPQVCDSETSEIRAVGTLALAEDGLTLSYREEESGISVLLQKTGDEITIKRGGAMLVFRVGKKTDFVYRTAYGEIPTEAYTEEITMKGKDNTFLLTLTYTATLGGMAQKNEMRFKITY